MNEEFICLRSTTILYLCAPYLFPHFQAHISFWASVQKICHHLFFSSFSLFFYFIFIFILFYFILFYLFFCHHLNLTPEYSLEGLMLKLKLQYFGHLMWRTDSLEKTLMLGKIEGRRRSIQDLYNDNTNWWKFFVEQFGSDYHNTLWN